MSTALLTHGLGELAWDIPTHGFTSVAEGGGAAGPLSLGGCESIPAIIAKGIGFSVGNIGFVVTHGFGDLDCGGGAAAGMVMRCIRGNDPLGLDDWFVSYSG
jgi:hypothetical protein